MAVVLPFLLAKLSAEGQPLNAIGRSSLVQLDDLMEKLCLAE
jgi:hypothetical protein